MLEKVKASSFSIADYLVEMLCLHGVKHVFGYPGASIIPLLDAIDKNPDIEFVLMRNEAGAAFAASAYAKVTDRLAVCIATSGPGATNLITGLLDAQMDRAPVLAITGMPPTWKQGRHEFQDVDSAMVLSDLLPYSISCSHPDQLPSMFLECLGLSEQESCVTHLAIAYDVQSYCPENNDRRFRVAGAPEPPVVQLPPVDAFKSCGRSLSNSKGIILAVGPRARGAGKAIEELSEKLNAPIITSFDAKGIVDESHSNCLGVLGIFGSPGEEMAQKTIERADTIISFGLDVLNPFVACEDGIQIRTLIQCEPKFGYATRRFHREHTLIGPIEPIAQALSSNVSKLENNSFLKFATDLRSSFMDSWKADSKQVSKSVPGSKAYIHPVRFLEALNKRVGENGIVVLDTGDNAVWAAQFLTLSNRRSVIVSENIGAMGFSIPALSAVKLADKNNNVIGICGDGGFQMMVGELAVASQLGLNYVLAVFNNGILGRILAQEHRPSVSHIHNPDFELLAKAYGAEAAVITGDCDLEATLNKAFEHKGSPYILDVRLDPEIFAPMSKWDGGFVPIHFT